MTTASLPATRGAELVTVDGRTLPLVATSLIVTAGGGLARTLLRQRFRNPHQEPLTVTYQLPLPADGAVAAFAFAIGDRRIVGEIDGRAAARERFEQALADGHTAALLEQDRSSLFHQAIGNVPPGAEVVAEITVDQPLLWAADHAWEYRFPTTVAPRYLGADGRVADAGRLAGPVTADAVPPRLTLSLHLDDRLADGATPTSPSHALHVDADRTVSLQAEAGARLDRDLVVRWRTGSPEVGASLATARPPQTEAHVDVAYGLLTLVPPLQQGRSMPRDLTVLLDTSGSMSGEPLDQAKAVVAILIDSLGDADQLQMIEFSTRPRRWLRGPVAATAATRRRAQQWLQSLQAGGGTEMRDGVLESLRSLRQEGQSQVLLITDGLVGFEQEIVQALLHKLPRGCRLHVLGVGSAPNRSLSSACARAGRGVEVCVGIGEDPAAASRSLLAAMQSPLVVDLELSGSALLGTAPAQLPDLFAGAPARLSLQLRPEGGTLTVRGRSATGGYACELAVPPNAPANGRQEVVSRCGRELVEDLEMQLAGGADLAATEVQIEALGRRFRLATRCTSWVAISDEPTVDPQAPVRRERIAHELPFGMSVEGLGLRTAAPGFCGAPAPACDLGMVAEAASPPRGRAIARPASVAKRKSLFGFGGGAADKLREESSAPPPPAKPAPLSPPRPAVLVWQNDDRLRLELDGDADWQLPDHVVLHFADGTSLTVAVVKNHSTRSGHLPAGTRAVLTLALPPSAPKLAPVAVDVHAVRHAIVPQR